MYFLVSSTSSCSVRIMHFSQYLYSANRDVEKQGFVIFKARRYLISSKYYFDPAGHIVVIFRPFR